MEKAVRWTMSWWNDYGTVSNTGRLVYHKVYEGVLQARQGIKNILSSITRSGGILGLARLPRMRSISIIWSDQEAHIERITNLADDT